MMKKHDDLANKLTAAASKRRKIDGAWRAGLAIFAIAASGSLFATPTATGDSRWQDTAEIETAARLYIKERVGGEQTSVAANPLDPRIRLARCDKALEAFVRPGTRIRARTTVGVRCTGSRSWKVYVPVDLVETADVLIPKRALRRGQIIAADDLVADHRDVSRLHSGYFTRTEELIGQRVKATVSAGRVITPSMIEPDVVIQRGQTVTLSVANSAVSIRMAGKAMQDGGLHQRIKVKNLNSGRIIEGFVRSPENVEVLVPGSTEKRTKSPKVSAAVADTRLSNNDR